MIRVNRFWIILPVLGGILLLSTIQTSGSTPRVASTPQFPVGSGSWNPRVSCSSPWIIRITDMTNNMTGSASLSSSIFNPGITSPVGDAKRWLTPGATPSGWVSPGPPCTITNSHGQVSMFVEIDGVKRGTIGNGDCTATYDPVNGGTSNGGNYCDTDFNIYDPAVVPNYSTSCSSATDPTCYGRIHIEIDHDWKAAGYCGASTACDDVAMNSQTNSSSVIDVQGFVYWDADNTNQQWHSFSGWEIHAVTGWRFHQNRPTGTYFDHLVVIMMENEGISQICGGNPPPCNGPNSPYMSSLANTYGIASQYVALNKTSLPNYVGMIGGSTYGCATTCPTINSPNLVDRLEAAGLSWKAYMESQNAASGCVTTTQLPYFPRHNPFVQFQDITNSTSRCNKIVLANPISCGSVTDCTLLNDLNSLAAPNFIWLTPNVCNDMHGNSTCTNGCTSPSTTCIVDGDNYLSSLVPNILNSKTFNTTRSALFITFDEGTGFCPLNNSSEECMYAVWAGPVARTGFGTSHLYNHYSFLKTVEVNWNLTSLTTNDANATPMTEFVSSDSGAPPPTPPTGAYFDHVVVIMMENEGISDICGRSPPPCNGSNSPHMSTLANSNGLALQYLSLIGTSQPNYIGILGGSIFSCTKNGNCPSPGTITAPNLVDRMEATGLTWKGYMENQTPAAGCDTSSHGSYEHEHNGFVEFQDITNSTSRCNKILLANPGSCGTVTDCTLINDLNSSSAPNFMWLTPNDCNNMHGSSVCTNGCTTIPVSTACITKDDTYLNTLVSSILNSNAFQSQRSALFITFDEGTGFCPLNGSSEDCLYAVWAGPAAKTSFSSSHLYNHYSLTKTIEVNWNLTSLTSNDGSATPMTEFFNPVPNFMISATSPASVNAGQAANSIITVTSVNGFAGTVSLTDTVPGGLTCGAISPSSLIGSGTATLSCTSNTAGRYTANVTGTSNSLVHSASATFNFVNFTITASSPAPVNAGQSPSSTITIAALNGFAGIVTLTDTIPLGLTCGSITPTSISGSGTAIVSCSATNAGNYTLTITGTSGSLIHTATALYQFRDFTVAASSVTVNAGAPGASTITVTAINKFAGVVTLADSIPTGLVCGSITPGSVTGSGTATVSCSAAIQGNYTLTITGTSGSLVHTATPIFHIQDFGIAASSPAPVNVGSSVTSTMTISSINHFAGVVSLTDTVPSGLTCGTITPSSVTGSGTATVSCTSTVAGNYTLTVIGTSGSLVHSTTALFQFRDFTISTTTPGPVDSNQSVTPTITVTALNHFNGFVNLTDTVPAGLTCSSIAPTSVTGSGTAMISCSASVAGNYTLTITGSSGSLVHSATVVLRFQDFTISATSPAAVNAGQSPTSTVTIVAINGFTGTVTFSLTAPPSLTCGSFSPTSIIASGSAIISCSATVPGNYTATITGTSTPLIHNATATFQFRDFTITATSPTPANAGNSTTSTITVAALNHFAGSVSLTDTVPSGLNCGTIAPNTVTGSGTATVSCNATVAGNYTLTITGTSGSLVHSAIAVFRFQDFTISVSSPAPANVGSSPTSTITVAAVNGFAGAVSFSDTVPSSLTCGAITPASITGSGTATVSCSATVAGNYTLTVTGTSGILAHSATSIFQFRDFTLTSTSLVAANVGESITSTLTVSALNHFSGSVLLSDTVPGGLTCGVISPGNVTGSGTATVSCGASLAGNYTLTLTGTSGQLVHSTTTLFQFWDFSTSASSPAPVNAGTSAISIITITPTNHFNGIISLTDNVPSGLACGTISPTSITGSGTATVSCNATVSGNYTLTVTGTNGALSHSATIIISVQDYTITTNLANAVINAGTTGSSTITITPLNHFSGTVSLSPTSTTGLTLAINPTSIPGGSGTATLTFSSNTAGNYTVTINSSNGTLAHSITLTVQIVDFAIAANPSTITILAGATGNSTVTITALNRFGGTVNLTLTPSMGLTATIAPNSIAGSGSARLTVGASTSGDYSVTMRATSGSLSHSIGIVIHVLDYSLTGNPTSLIAPIGSNTSSSLTVQSLNGYGGNVSLTFTVQPETPAPGVGGSGGGRHALVLAPPAAILPNVSINPQSFLLSPGGTQQSTVSISLSPNLPLGNYLITVTSSDGTLSHEIVLTLVATDFSLTATPSSASLPSGSSATIVLNLQSLNSFQGNVTLTLTSQAGGPTGTLSRSTLQLAFNSNVNLNLTINVPSNTAAGNYTITIQATSGTVSHTLVMPVRVTTSGLLSILTGVLNPSNSTSISAIAIFSLFAIFASPRIRAFYNQKPSTFRRSKIENRISRRTPTTRFIPCSSSLPLLWRPTSRDEI